MFLHAALSMTVIMRRIMTNGQAPRAISSSHGWTSTAPNDTLQHRTNLTRAGSNVLLLEEANWNSVK